MDHVDFVCQKRKVPGRCGSSYKVLWRESEAGQCVVMLLVKCSEVIRSRRCGDYVPSDRVVQHRTVSIS